MSSVQHSFSLSRTLVGAQGILGGFNKDMQPAGINERRETHYALSTLFMFPFAISIF